MATPRPGSGDLPEMLELGLLLGRVRRRIRGRVQHALEARGKTLFSWAALRHLAGAGPSTQRELAEATAQHPAHVSRLLVDLEQAGLLRRWRDPHDRRCLRVGLSAKGRRTLAEGNPAVAAGIAEALDALGTGDLLVLRALLRKVLGLEAGPARVAPGSGSAIRGRGRRGTRRSAR